MTLISLLAYFWFSSQIYRSDKTEFAYQTYGLFIENLSRRIQSEADTINRLVSYFTVDLSPDSTGLAKRGQKIYEQNENILGVWFYQFTNDKAKLVFQMRKQGLNSNPPVSFMKNSTPSEFVIKLPEDSDSNVFAYYPYGEQTKFLFILQIKNEELHQLINENGLNIYHFPSQSVLAGSSTTAHSSLFSRIDPMLTPKGILKKVDNLDIALAYTYLPRFKWLVVSGIERDFFANVFKKILEQSSFFLLGLIGFILILGTFLARRLTKALSQITLATKDIGKGNFNVNIKINSGDEIEELAKGINVMSKEVGRLMEENIEKTRMEKELETAKAIQENILPPPEFENDFFRVHGYYQSASECAGDWWYYHTMQKKCFFIVGDATGHGVHSALITSAARAALSHCLRQGILEPSTVLGHLNKTIFDVSKGHVLMTAFCGLFDFSMNVLSYSSASHDFPLLKKKDGNLDFLMNSMGDRLGDNEDETYSTQTLEICSGDRLFIYTDGITEALNAKEMQFGDRRLYKRFKEFEGKDLISHMVEEVNKFSSGRLDDDITLVDFVIR